MNQDECLTRIRVESNETEDRKTDKQNMNEVEAGFMVQKIKPLLGTLASH